MNKQSWSKYIAAGSLGLLISGCAASITPIKPEAHNVVFSTGNPPAQCRYIERITHTYVNGVTRSFTSHQNLQADEIAILKNETSALGGNLFVVTEHYTTFVQRSDYSRVDTHYIAGDVYNCPIATVFSR